MIIYHLVLRSDYKGGYLPKNDVLSKVPEEVDFPLLMKEEARHKKSLSFFGFFFFLSSKKFFFSIMI